MSNYSAWAVASWAIIFALNAYTIMVDSESTTESKEKIYLVLGFMIPLLVTIVWYTFFSGNETFTTSLLVMYVITGVPLVILIYIYAKIIVHFRRVLDKQHAKKMCYQIIGYPTVLVINLLVTICVTVMAQADGCFSLVSVSLNGVWCFQGLIDAVLYGFNPVLRNEVENYRKRKSTISLDTSRLAEALN